MRLRGRKGIRENLEQQVDLVVLDPKQYKGKWSAMTIRSLWNLVWVKVNLSAK